MMEEPINKKKFLEYLYKGGSHCAYPIISYIDELLENNQKEELFELLNEIEVYKLDTYASVALLTMVNLIKPDKHIIINYIIDHIYNIDSERADKLVKGFSRI